MKFPPVDWASIAGVVALAEIATVALLNGGQPGITVAASCAGAIGGWLAKSFVDSAKQANGQ